MLQVGQVIARSHVPRGACDSPDDIDASRWIVDGAGFTSGGLPAARGTNTEGGSVPRGNFSMTGTDSMPV